MLKKIEIKFILSNIPEATARTTTHILFGDFEIYNADNFN